MQCPRCGLLNPESSGRCDCGYDFGARAVIVTQPGAGGGGLDVRSIASGYSRNAILGQRWGALLLDIIVLVVAFVGCGVAIGGKGDLPFIVWSVLVFAYFVILEGKWGVTLGKLAAKLRVVDASGRPPGYGRALVRMLLRLVEVNPLLAGGIPAGIIAALSKHRQRLGDMLAGTYVLNATDTARLGRL